MDASTSPAPPDTRLPPVVRTVGWISFFADVSSEMAFPLLPLFLVGGLGAPATTLGLMEGLAAALVAVLAFVSGRASDRAQRRVPAVRWGYALPVAGKALIAVATAWPLVIAGRLVDRTGKGLRGAPRDALLADATPPHLRGRAYGFHRAMDTGGAFVGILLSAALLVALDDGARPAGVEPVPLYRTVFAIAAALGVISFALTLRLREPDRPAASGARPAPPAAGRAAAAGRAGSVPGATAGTAPARGFRTTLLVLLLFALANSSDAFLLLRARALGLSATGVVLAWALANLVYALGSYPAGRLSDRLGRFVPIGLGWGLYVLVYLGFAFAGGTAPVGDSAAGPSGMLGSGLLGGDLGTWALFAAYGIPLALTDGVGKALLADLAAPSRRATQLGFAAMGLGLAGLLGSLVAGALWDASGPRAAFLFGAGAAALALLALPLAARARRPAHA